MPYAEYVEYCDLTQPKMIHFFSICIQGLRIKMLSFIVLVYFRFLEMFK